MAIQSGLMCVGLTSSAKRRFRRQRLLFCRGMEAARGPPGCFFKDQNAKQTWDCAKLNLSTLLPFLFSQDMVDEQDAIGTVEGQVGCYAAEVWPAAAPEEVPKSADLFKEGSKLDDTPKEEVKLAETSNEEAESAESRNEEGKPVETPNEKPAEVPELKGSLVDTSSAALCAHEVAIHTPVPNDDDNDPCGALERLYVHSAISALLELCHDLQQIQNAFKQCLEGIGARSWQDYLQAHINHLVFPVRPIIALRQRVQVARPSREIVQRIVKLWRNGSVHGAPAKSIPACSMEDLQVLCNEIDAYKESLEDNPLVTDDLPAALLTLFRHVEAENEIEEDKDYLRIDVIGNSFRYVESQFHRLTFLACGLYCPAFEL